MSFLGPNVATLGQVAAATASTTVFSAATGVSGRSIYNGSTAICYLTYGTVSSTTAYTTQIAATSSYSFAAPTFAGPVTAVWAAANGSAFTTQW